MQIPFERRSATNLPIEELRVRIEAAREAIKRTRLVFLASSVTSLAVILVAWNAYLSWYRAFALQGTLPANEVTREAYLELMKLWVDSHFVSVALLGIRAGVSDMALIGSVTLFTLALWFFLAMRRENHTIGTLLRDTKGEDPRARRMVFHGIVSYLVFITVTQGDYPLRTLGPAEPRDPVKFVRPIVSVLTFLPAIAIATVILLDVASVVFQQAPFRFPHDPLYHVLKPGDWGKAALMEGVALIIGTLTSILSLRTSQFSDATGEILREYEALDSQPQRRAVSYTHLTLPTICSV